MSELSIGLDYAWQTAASEAARTRHEFIEPEHLFIGVCKLGNLLSLNDWNEIKIPRDAAAALKAEAEVVAAVFQKAGHNRTVLYRNVRKRFGEGRLSDSSRKKISRSAASRLIFERAGKLAADASVVTSLHLLSALLETPGTGITAALAEKPPGAEALKQAVLSFIAASPS